MSYENQKIRQFREARGLTLQELASQCGLTRGYLSRIERSSKAPPVSTLQTICRALGVEWGELIGAAPVAVPWSHNLDFVARKDVNVRTLLKTGEGYAYHSLVGALKNKAMAPVVMVVQKGKTKRFTHDAEEFVYVLSGAARLHYEGKVLELARGDSVYFDSRLPHAFEVVGRREAVLLAVTHGYRRF